MPFDLADWKEALKQPFDPWVIETDDGLILRSSQLDLATTSSDACERADILMEQINGALAITDHSAEEVRAEGIAEIMSDGRRNVLVQVVGTAKARSRAGAVGVAIGPDGKPMRPPPPERSNPQQWLSIAAEDDLLADALTYFGRGNDWFDIYKALECLELRFGGERRGHVERFLGLGWADADEIGRLKRTANYKRRHARLKFDPPPNPMEGTEARDLLAKLMARAFYEAAKPTGSA
jgi:hypothetical protein